MVQKAFQYPFRQDHKCDGRRDGQIAVSNSALTQLGVQVKYHRPHHRPTGHLLTQARSNPALTGLI